MQVQERFVLTEMTRRVAEGERRARLLQARAEYRPSRRRTLLTALVHSLGL